MTVTEAEIKELGSRMKSICEEIKEKRCVECRFALSTEKYCRDVFRGLGDDENIFVLLYLVDCNGDQVRMELSPFIVLENPPGLSEWIVSKYNTAVSNRAAQASCN